jgi:hypothetical protein
VNYIKAWEIVGYTYQAETLCPGCTIASLPTGPGEAFDGWRDVTGRMSAEDNLSELACAFGIDRNDESSYDSDEFPKVVFASSVEGDETCDRCGGELI